MRCCKGRCDSVSPLPLLLAILAVLVVFGGCYTRMANSVNGSGVAKTESRQPGEFDRVRLDGSADVWVTVGGAGDAVETAPPGGVTSVSVSADDNVVPLIETEVRGGELVVSSRTSYRAKTRVKVTITTPALRQIQVNGSGRATVADVRGGQFEAVVFGSGDVRVDRLDVDRFDVRVTGSGDVAANGSADDLHVSVSGSGDVKLRDVTARTADVSISGSGDATINAAATLKARISGSGDVRYHGRPKVDASTTGSGKVKASD